MVFMYALLGGFVPALFWLWFWLHERQSYNEPRKIIAQVFLLGMTAVFISYILQRLIAGYLTYSFIDTGIFDIDREIQDHPLLTLIFVIIEEMTKFGAAYVVAFKTKIFDEPIDAFVYLMTAALGFAAMENTLYLIQPLLQGQTIETIVTSYMRFIGSSVLHVTTSGALSVCIGLSFCKSFWIREMWIWVGLVIACLIHWAFNVFLIIQDGSSAFLVFSSMWMVAIALIIMLEKVKQNKCM
jgi:protease PrsW